MPNLKIFTSELFLVVDGALQRETNRVDVRFGPLGARVYARWAVGETLEFDGRESAVQRTAHRISVTTDRGDIVLSGGFRCSHFAVGQPAPGKWPLARALFVEPDVRLVKADSFDGHGRLRPGEHVTYDPVTSRVIARERPKNGDPFGYSLERARHDAPTLPPKNPFGYTPAELG